MSKPFIVFMASFILLVAMAVLVPSMRLSSGMLKGVAFTTLLCLSLLVVAFFAGLFGKRKPKSQNDSKEV